MPKLACPACGIPMVLLKGVHGLFYRCARSPLCDFGVSCHPGTDEPMGTPPDADTRRWRDLAHKTFDCAWSGSTARMTRAQAYGALQEAFGMTEEEAHIGRFSRAQCQQLIRLMWGHDGQKECEGPLATVGEAVRGRA